ncbi:hypothetical protein AUC68_10495 [Methyloceanibacter methanicus]|uniref:BFD-like [2Fe-2S]-binding domain-containing protein n=1 Tax=Methyloceanibacter methanicus TaxID=1774968 RepID=A0A1E3VXE5_9HYPH|nr:hypothetical protein AUC68_10495 [Methyloceanibacter methanicus]
MIAKLSEVEAPQADLCRPSRLAGAGKSMMVCSCHTICESDIHDVVSLLRTNDPAVVLTAGLICRTLGKRPQCGNCLPQVIKIILGLDDDEDSPDTLISCRVSCDDACMLDQPGGRPGQANEPTTMRT